MRRARQATPAEAIRKLRKILRANWKNLRIVVTLMMLGFAAWFIVSRSAEWAEAAHLLAHASWTWIGMAVLFEAASMVVFARLQRWLLRAGGVRVQLRTMVEITVAGNAVAATLPGGVAWSAAWVFGQLGRRGVNRFLRVWVFLVAGAVSSFALFVVVAGGIELSGGSGPVAGLRWGAFGLACIPVAALVLVALHNTRTVKSLYRAALENLEHQKRFGPFLLRHVKSMARKIEAVHLSVVGWAEALAFALLNWLYDCLVLVASMLALHVAVPWRGIFVIYGLTQIAAVLPITPGGVVVVEGTLAGLLSAYGVHAEGAFATVVLYRLISFWALVPIGWAFWTYLNLREEKGLGAPRPHPWAVHLHAVASSAGTERKDGEPVAAGLLHRLASPKPCRGCDDQKTGREDLELGDAHLVGSGKAHISASGDARDHDAGVATGEPEHQEAGSPQ